MQILDKIIVSPTAPSSKNVAWFDGKSIKIQNKGKWENASESSGGGGIQIVDSEEKLNSLNVPVGSLAAVAVQGSMQEMSFRDLYQPTMDMIDQATGEFINPERLSSISSLKITAPSSFELEKSMIILFIPRTWSVANNNTLMLGLQGGTGIAAVQTINNREEHTFVLVDYSSGSPVINNDSIKQVNDILATDDWCYFGNPESTTGMTEEQFNTLDMYVKAVLSVQNTAEIYIKKDNWEQLYAKDFEKLVSDIKTITESKADKIPIESYNEIINVNKYSVRNISKTETAIFYLEDEVDATNFFNEYIIEIKCTETPAKVIFLKKSNGEYFSIRWAAGAAPTFKKDYTYLISISNGLGVYSIFPNE